MGVNSTVEFYDKLLALAERFVRIHEPKPDVTSPPAAGATILCPRCKSDNVYMVGLDPIGTGRCGACNHVFTDHRCKWPDTRPAAPSAEATRDECNCNHPRGVHRGGINVPATHCSVALCSCSTFTPKPPPAASFEEAVSRYAEIVLVGGCKDGCMCPHRSIEWIEEEQARQAAKTPQHAERIKAARQRVVEMYEAMRAKYEHAHWLLDHAGVTELAASNPNVASYCAEWERRAEKAEAEAARVKAQVERVKAMADEYRGYGLHSARVVANQIDATLADVKP